MSSFQRDVHCGARVCFRNRIRVGPSGEAHVRGGTQPWALAHGDAVAGEQLTEDVVTVVEAPLLGG